MSRGNTPSYEIARLTGRCAASGDEIRPGQRYVATLCERDEDEGFNRLDYSLAAWESGARPDRLFSYWKATAPEPDTSRKTFIDDEALLNLFQRLEGDEQPQRIAYRFVIGLILMRKKLLKLDRTNQDGDQTVWHMRMRGEPPETPPIEVIDPKMTEEQAQQVSDQLSEVLRGDW